MLRPDPKIVLASDHGGFRLKEEVKKHLKKEGYEVLDIGTRNEKSVDYPKFGLKAAKLVSQKEVERGILFCGTGLGMMLTANKVKGIRAVVCSDIFSAKLSRLHNDVNILCLGGHLLGIDLALEIVMTWLETPFSGGRHRRRINQIKRIEEE